MGNISVNVNSEMVRVVADFCRDLHSLLADRDCIIVIGSNGQDYRLYDHAEDVPVPTRECYVIRYRDGACLGLISADPALGLTPREWRAMMSVLARKK